MIAATIKMTAGNIQLGPGVKKNKVVGFFLEDKPIGLSLIFGTPKSAVDCIHPFYSYRNSKGSGYSRNVRQINLRQSHMVRWWFFKYRSIACSSVCQFHCDNWGAKRDQRMAMVGKIVGPVRWFSSRWSWWTYVTPISLGFIVDISRLVVWNMFFPNIGNVIIPTDELIFFRWVETTNQYHDILYGGCQSTNRFCLGSTTTGGNQTSYDRPTAAAGWEH